MFDLNYLYKHKMSLTKALFIFYLFIANNYTKELYSGQLTDFIKENRLVQHFIGFLTLVIIIMMTADVKDPTTAFIYGIMGYTFFIMTTKVTLEFNLVILTLLFLGFLYENILDDKEEMAYEDPVLTNEERKKIKKKNREYKEKIFYLIALITIVGMTSYLLHKRSEYGDQFSLSQFLLGKGKRYA